jgi:hypothetical protein
MRKPAKKKQKKRRTLVADQTKDPRRGPSDATDYSSTHAPETPQAPEDVHPSDPRLNPGGAHGSTADPGMSSLHEEDVPTDPHRTR